MEYFEGPGWRIEQNFSKQQWTAFQKV
jgi:hypothetical protein